MKPPFSPAGVASPTKKRSSSVIGAGGSQQTPRRSSQVGRKSSAAGRSGDTPGDREESMTPRMWSDRCWSRLGDSVAEEVIGDFRKGTLPHAEDFAKQFPRLALLAAETSQLNSSRVLDEISTIGGSDSTATGSPFSNASAKEPCTQQCAISQGALSMAAKAMASTAAAGPLPMSWPTVRSERPGEIRSEPHVFLASSPRNAASQTRIGALGSVTSPRIARLAHQSVSQPFFRSAQQHVLVPLTSPRASRPMSPVKGCGELVPQWLGATAVAPPYSPPPIAKRTESNGGTSISQRHPSTAALHNCPIAPPAEPPATKAVSPGAQKRATSPGSGLPATYSSEQPKATANAKANAEVPTPPSQLAIAALRGKNSGYPGLFALSPWPGSPAAHDATLAAAATKLFAGKESCKPPPIVLPQASSSCLTSPRHIGGSCATAPPQSPGHCGGSVTTLPPQSPRLQPPTPANQWTCHTPRQSINLPISRRYPTPQAQSAIVSRPTGGLAIPTSAPCSPRSAAVPMCANQGWSPFSPKVTTPRGNVWRPRSHSPGKANGTSSTGFIFYPVPASELQADSTAGHSKHPQGLIKMAL